MLPAVRSLTPSPKVVYNGVNFVCTILSQLCVCVCASELLNPLKHLLLKQPDCLLLVCKGWLMLSSLVVIASVYILCILKDWGGKDAKE